MLPSCTLSKSVLNARHHFRKHIGMASWRSGDAEDCKSLYPGSIPGEASIPIKLDRPVLHRLADGVQGRMV